MSTPNHLDTSGLFRRLTTDLRTQVQYVSFGRPPPLGPIIEYISDMQARPAPLPLALLALGLGRAAAAEEAAPPALAPADRPRLEGALLAREGARLRVAVPTEGMVPGGELALYVEELRLGPDGAPLSGLRYAGDARLIWVGPGQIELELAPGAAPPAEGRVLLGPARGLKPTPPWTPPPPPVAAAPPPPPPAARARQERAPLPGIGFDTAGSPLGTLHDHPSGPRQALVLSGGWAGDGYGTGAGTGAIAWRLSPKKGPGRVEIGLEGLGGERWVEGAGEDEPWGTEPVAGAWLWTRLDGAAIGLAPIVGLGLGVDAEGPALATVLGLRSGHPDRSRVELLWERRGALGQRLSLDGRVALADPLRLGARARLGDLPRHEGDLEQLRADGALLLSVDPTRRLRLTLAGGLGAYDLLWADAGPVLDGALELRW